MLRGQYSASVLLIDRSASEYGIWGPMKWAFRRFWYDLLTYKRHKDRVIDDLIEFRLASLINYQFMKTCIHLIK